MHGSDPSARGRQNPNKEKRDAPQLELVEGCILDFFSSLHLDPNMRALNMADGLNIRHPALLSVPISASTLSVKYLVRELQKVSWLWFNHKSSPSIHPSLQLHLPQRHARIAQKSLRTFRTSVDDFSRLNELGQEQIHQLLFELNVRTAPLQEILATFHSLISTTILLLFNASARKHQRAETNLQDLRRIASLLIVYAPELMPNNLTPWGSWVLGESIRRTILMVYVVGGTYSAWLRGYCNHELFIEALPFDARIGLWSAGSEGEWTATLNCGQDRPGNGNGPCHLVSCHEFTTSFITNPFNPGPDTFQKLLLIAHHGRVAVDKAIGTEGLWDTRLQCQILSAEVQQIIH